MITTVTNEMLARIFGAYMPCKIIIDDTHRYLIGVDWGEGYISYGELTESGEPDYDYLADKCTIDKIQLILSPLSEISDEDAIEVAKIITYIPSARADNHIDLWSIDETYFYCAGENIPTTKQFINSLPTEAVDFLRSRSYDCGFANIPSLIEAGMAIKKTK